LGYGTDSGPRLLAAWDSRYLNEQGHRLETDLQFSPITSVLSGVYIMPHARITAAELGLSSSLAREDTDTHTSNTFKFGTLLLRKRGSWNESVGLTYQFESFDVAGVEDTSNLLMPGITYWKNVSETPIYTDNGYRLSLNLRGAVSGVLSNQSFLQALVSGKYIHSIGDAGRLIGRGELGATYVPEFEVLPASIRFFAGGDNSIRGFDLQSLGPKNAEGNVIGGRYLTVGSIEYEHRLFDKWSLAAFTDFGNAFDDYSNDFVYSTGAGIRWRTPVGLIRVDLAFGVSEDPVPFRLHINIGPDL
jgi:translocation and assembly module TamA